MAKRGHRKYRCTFCKAETFHHWIERNRAAGVRCPRCGSRGMELVSEEAKRDAADLQAVRVEGGTPSTTRPRPARRKIT